MRVKKTIWRPLVLGLIMGTLAGITTVPGLSFLTPGITENAIGFFGVLFLLAAALGGPLSGVIASTLWVIILTLFGPPELIAILLDGSLINDKPDRFRQKYPGTNLIPGPKYRFLR